MKQKTFGDIEYGNRKRKGPPSVWIGRALRGFWQPDYIVP